MKGDDFKMVMEGAQVAVDHMEKRLREEMRQEVAREVGSHRQAVWGGEKWCCTDMVTFAKFAWNLPNPPKGNEFGQTRLQLRGGFVNYCPFCGVKVG